MFVILICVKVSNEWSATFIYPKHPSKLSKIVKKVGGPWFDWTLVQLRTNVLDPLSLIHSVIVLSSPSSYFAHEFGVSVGRH